MQYGDLETRLDQAVGRLVIQWQKLVDTLESTYGNLFSAESSESTFAQLLERWRKSSAKSDLIDEKIISHLYIIASSYHLVRDAVAHGTPWPQPYCYVDDRNITPVFFSMRTRKAEYKSEWIRSLKELFGEDKRAALVKYSKNEYKSYGVFHFFYALEDIEDIAYSYLDELKLKVNLIYHVTDRVARGAVYNRDQQPISSLNGDALPRRVMPLLNIKHGLTQV